AARRERPPGGRATARASQPAARVRSEGGVPQGVGALRREAHGGREMGDFTLTIDGKSRPGEGSFGVVNPATGQVFAQAPACSRAQLDEAMEAAHRAFGPWQRDEARRRSALVACAEAIQARLGELAPILTQEQGKPLARANEELIGAAVWFRYTAGLEIPVEV